MSVTDPEQSLLVHQLLEASAERFPDKNALVCDDVRATYLELNRVSNRVAHWLTGQRLSTGDRVAILMENSLEYVAGYYGILKAGGVAVPLSGDLKPDGLRELLRRLEGKALITSSRFEALVQAVGFDSLPVELLLVHRPSLRWDSCPFAVHSWADVAGAGSSDNPNLAIAGTELASIIFTSGSTGQPKGVMLTHGNIVANTQAICRYLELTPTDRQMVVLPFHYVMGKSLLNTHVAAGGSVVINNRFAFPAEVLQQMVVEEVTGFSGVPSTYAYLLHRSPLKAYRDRLTSLRYCSQAGGHLAWPIKEELLRVLPAHTRLFVMYGATEASARLTYVEPERLLEKRDSIGRPLDGVVMRVVDEQGKECPLGEVGELVADGPNIMVGYWRDPAATEAALGPFGYRTGDLGYQDRDGYFYVVGRKDAQLKVGGHRLNPQEIEDALIDTGLIVQAVVLGLPDAMLGQKMVALAVPVRSDVSVPEILQGCADRLPRHKIPGEIHLVPRLPQNPSGKIDRGRCRELLDRNSDG